jgi:hypothetical protein
LEGSLVEEDILEEDNLEEEDSLEVVEGNLEEVGNLEERDILEEVFEDNSEDLGKMEDLIGYKGNYQEDLYLDSLGKPFIRLLCNKICRYEILR